MDAGVAISIVAILIAAGSLALALRADRRAGRAEARGLRAHVVVEPNGWSGSASGRRFDLRVRNVGSDVARDVDIWLEDESGRVVSTRTVERTLTLAPGEDPAELALTVPDSALPPPPVSFSVWMSWSDSSGHHERGNSGATVST